MQGTYAIAGKRGALYCKASTPPPRQKRGASPIPQETSALYNDRIKGTLPVTPTRSTLLMKHLIDDLFDDDKLPSSLALDNSDMPKFHMEAITLDPDDFKFVHDVPENIPILALRDAVLFPGIAMPIEVTRESSKKLLKEARRNRSVIGVVTQRTNVEEPNRKDLYDIGCLATVLSVSELENGGNESSVCVICGGPRFRVREMVQSTPYMRCKTEMVPAEDHSDFKGAEARSVIAILKRKFNDLSRDSAIHFSLGGSLLSSLRGNGLLLNTMSAHVGIPVDQKQLLLETTDQKERAKQLLAYMEEARKGLKIEAEMKQKVHQQMDRQQREYYLQQQLHAIQDELGGNPYDKDMEEMEAKAKTKHWKPEVAEYFDREIQRLHRIPPQQPDFYVQQNYLEFMLNLPWDEYTKDNLDLAHARKILDRDHYGLEKIKDRIIEYIAVMQLKGDLKSPILCLVGPPGTGKTSLGKSIADALGRKYVRMALGGVHDESEVRGHRRTYVGAMSGRVMQSIERAGSSNPVFILDEIDKVQSNSFNGDPTAALLEVLDPEQNAKFHDNYLDVDYDLSKCLFIATANSLSTVQPALLDRMEIIELSGYTMEEKIEIAKRHLLPRQLKEHGFKASQIKLPDTTLEHVIDEYTHESGVRQMEKAIAKVIRRRAVKMLSGVKTPPTVKVSELKDLLGLPIHKSDRMESKNRVGVVTGLAWTQMGGVILFVEASLSKGKGTLTMTGNLGDVMKESATLAFEYIKANAKQLDIAQKVIDCSNIHIHCPEGATPKDGPSAGITMFTAMVSALTGRKVHRNVAMTGEITLRGEVTPIGGVKEKILAAKRAGIDNLVLCEDNRRDVEDINPDYLKGLHFHYIAEMSEVLPLALD